MATPLPVPPFLVKVCGVTEESDAVQAVQAGATALGFNFYSRSPRYVTVERARTVAEAAGNDYLRVGVFVNPSPADLEIAIEIVGLQAIQIHGPELPELPEGVAYLRAIAPAAGPPKGEPPASAYLLDTPSPEFGGTGIAFAWHLAANFDGRAILAGGLDATNVAEAIATAQPWGVDACSRLESSPGRKDPVRTAAFIRAAHQAFQAGETK